MVQKWAKKWPKKWPKNGSKNGSIFGSKKWPKNGPFFGPTFEKCYASNACVFGFWRFWATFCQVATCGKCRGPTLFDQLWWINSIFDKTGYFGYFAKKGSKMVQKWVILGHLLFQLRVVQKWVQKDPKMGLFGHFLDPLFGGYYLVTSNLGVHIR